jgi:hypothetical protein
MAERTRKKLTTEDEAFIQGFACAVSILEKGWRETGLAKMVFQEGGYTLADLKRAHVDQYDLDIARRIFRKG